MNDNTVCKETPGFSIFANYLKKKKNTLFLFKYRYVMQTLTKTQAW